MFAWLVVEAEHRDLVPPAAAKAWRRATAAAADLALPAGRNKTRQLVFVWNDGGCEARAPRWPDLLAEWSEIYDEELFPEPGLAALAEVLSGLGADVLIAHAAPGLRQATTIWYAKGAVLRYEHVGSSTVAWTEAGGLGRPFDGSVAQLAASVGKKVADLVGSDRDLAVLDRIENTNRAVGEVLLDRAFFTLLGADPPPMDELAGMVERAPRFRLAIP